MSTSRFAGPAGRLVCLVVVGVAGLGAAVGVSLHAQQPQTRPSTASPGAPLVSTAPPRASAVPRAPQGPGLGVPATPADIAAVDISISPDGAGLPAGSGTAAQGAEVYTAKCLACHGAEGVNGLNDRLVGGQGTLAGAAPVKTIGSYWPYATTLFDFVRRAMPYPTPHTLTDAEAYAVTAYLLHLNGIIPADAVMNATTLPQVRMPNRDGFVRATSRPTPPPTGVTAR